MMVEARFQRSAANKGRHLAAERISASAVSGSVADDGMLPALCGQSESWEADLQA